MAEFIVKDIFFYNERLRFFISGKKISILDARLRLRLRQYHFDSLLTSILIRTNRINGAITILTHCTL